MIAYRGFCLGYTISSCVSVLGISKGLVFIFSDLLIQNLLFIPAMLAIGVSGINLYKSIIKDKMSKNVKIEIARHTAFSTIMSMVLVFSSCIEVLVSNNILKAVVQYF